jgi:AcrR family transcriptional regulator
MQLGKLHQAVEDARKTSLPLPKFFRSLTELMTAEPVRNPDIIRILLLAFLSNPAVRGAMLDLQDRVLALHTEMIKIGQQRGEVRNDLPAKDIALVFRQTIFGTLLIWSLYGDASLQSRIDSAYEILWAGLAPREAAHAASARKPSS